MVVVAQLVRALDCGSRGRRFDPGLPPKKASILIVIWIEAFFICKNFVVALLQKPELQLM